MPTSHHHSCRHPEGSGTRRGISPGASRSALSHTCGRAHPAYSRVSTPALVSAPPSSEPPPATPNSLITKQSTQSQNNHQTITKQSDHKTITNQLSHKTITKQSTQSQNNHQTINSVIKQSQNNQLNHKQSINNQLSHKTITKQSAQELSMPKNSAI